MVGKTMFKRTLSISLVVLAGATSAFAEEPQGAFATTNLGTKIFLLDPLPTEANGAVSGWVYTMVAPDFMLTEATLDQNLRDNANKFCAGGKWKVLRKQLQEHRIDFAFACYDEAAVKFKNAAIAQGLPVTSLR